jgi:PAS domain S-box-containing protein
MSKAALGASRVRGERQVRTFAPRTGIILHVRTVIGRGWNWLRDTFSSSILGTTSPTAPSGLGGGLSRPARAAVTALSLAAALAAALLTGTPQGAVFFFPALMIAGLFGGALPGIAVLIASIVLAYYFFRDGLDLRMFVLAAMLQTATAIAMRMLFRESRRWSLRYRRLLSGVSSAVTVLDREGRAEREQPEFGKLIGLPWPAYGGHRWLEAIHPDDRDLVMPPRPYNTVEMQRAEIRIKDPATGDWRWYLSRALPMLDETGEVDEWVSVISDIHERRLGNEQQSLVIGEARHRLKNLITIIESLLKASRPRPADPATEAFQKKFLGRLHALSAASDLALACNYAEMDAADIVGATLAPFVESGRLSFGGPTLMLSQATGGPLALGVHELATNAIKHGALSVPEGRVVFTWSITPSEDGRRVEMVWKESGGPPPRKPEKEGYGARVIAFIPSREQNGTVTVEYPADGYVCRIAFIQPDRPRVKTLDVE